MSQSRPYLDELLRILGVDQYAAEKEHQQEQQPEPKPSEQKCLNCTWGTLTGDVIFCPFVSCEKCNHVFNNALYGGASRSVEISI